MRKFWTVVIVAALTGLLAVAPAGAQSRPKPDCEINREPPPGVWKNESNFNAVQKAWELVAGELYSDASIRFRELLQRIKDPFERTQAMFGLAQALMAQDQFDEALGLYEQIVNLDVLQNKPHYDAMFQIAQLYYMDEQYDSALRWIDRWLAESCEIRPAAYDLKASVYANREEYRQALVNVDKSIELSEKPKETRYQLKLAMHFELKEYEASRDVLQFMVRQWPDKRQYWTQLASVLVQLKDDQEALAVMALAKRKGMLEKESEWVQLFSLYVYLDMPFKGAVTLQEGIDKGIVEPTKRHWEQLGNAWYAAQELDEAVVALTEAAELALDGKIAMQVAFILVDKEDWEPAKKALRTALDKGGLTDSQTGNMYVLLGMSELSTGNSSDARDAFLQARKFPEARQSAQQWINHLDELAKG